MTNTLTRSGNNISGSGTAGQYAQFTGPNTVTGVASPGGSVTPQPKFYFPVLGGTFNYIEVVQYGTQATGGSVTIYEPGSGLQHTLAATTLGATYTMSGSTYSANTQTYVNFSCASWVQSATNSGIWVRVYGTNTSGPANGLMLEFKVPSTILNANAGTQANLTGA